MAYTTTSVNKMRRIGNKFYAYLKTNSYGPNILTSMNGSTWNPLNLEEPYSNYSCLEMAGSDSNILIAMRDPDNGNLVFVHSIDGETFTETARYNIDVSSMTMYWIVDQFVIVIGSNLLFTVDGSNLRPARYYDSLSMFTSITAFSVVENSYIRLDSNIARYTSSNAHDWVYGGPLEYEIKPNFLNNRFIYSYYNETSGNFHIASTFDGITLDTDVEIGTTNGISYDANTGEYFLIGGGTFTNKTFYTSYDLVNWTSSVSNYFVSYSSPHSPLNALGAYFVTFDDTNYRSTDLINWTPVQTSVSSLKAFNGTNMVTISLGVMYYSNDGITFTESNISGTFTNLFAVGTTFVAFDDGNMYVSFDDGVTWETRPLPEPTGLPFFTRMVFGYNGAMSYGTRIGIIYYINDVRYSMFTEDYGLTWNYTIEDISLSSITQENVKFDGVNMLMNANNRQDGRLYYTSGNAQVWDYWDNPVIAEGFSFNPDRISFLYLPDEAQRYMVALENNTLASFSLPDSQTSWQLVSEFTTSTDSASDLHFDYNGNIFVVKFIVYNDAASQEIDSIITSPDFITWNQRWLNSINSSETWVSGIIRTEQGFIPSGYIISANDILFASSDKNSTESGYCENYGEWVGYNLAKSEDYETVANDTLFVQRFNNRGTSLTEIRTSTDAHNWVTIVEDIGDFGYGPYVSQNSFGMIGLVGSTATLRVYDFDGNILSENEIREFANGEYIGTLFKLATRWVLVWTDGINTNSHIWTSDNEGASWNEVLVIPEPWYTSYIKKTFDVMVLGGGGETFYYSTDGNTWQEHSFPENTTYYTIDYSSSNNVYLLSAMNTFTGEMELYSAEGDGSFNWIQRSFPNIGMVTEYTVHDITATSDRFVLYAATDAPSSERSHLLYNTNDLTTFASWEEMPLPNAGGETPQDGIIMGLRDQNVNTATHMAVDRSAFNTVLLVGSNGSDG